MRDARALSQSRGLLVVRMVLPLLVVALVAACQVSPEELWRRAQVAQSAGDYQTASIHLKNLLQRQPNNAEARAALGEAALALGDSAAAEKELRRANLLGLRRPRIQVLLAQALLAQEKYAEALAELIPPTEKSTDPAVLLLAGRAHEGLRQLDEAEVRYRQTIEIAPNDAAGYVAAAALLLAMDRNAEADPLIVQALVRDPANVSALVLMGRRRLETSGPADAEALFQEAASAAREPRLRLLALMNLAEVQLIEEKIGLAATTLKELEAVSPNALITRYLRARWLAQSGDYPAAVRGLQEILRDQPDFEPGQRLLGTVHYLSGNLEQAAMYLSRVVGPEGGDSFLRRMLAELRLQQDRPEQAMQTLLPMMRQGPATVFDQGLLILAGQASLKLGDNGSALAFFRRGAAAYPDDERFMLGEVSAQLASGDLATARRLLEKMQATTSKRLAVDYLSVVTDLLQRRFEPALDLARRLEKENPGAPWSHLLLATVHLAAGDTVAARQQFEAVVTVDPRNREALINLAKLDMEGGDRAAGEARLKKVIDADPTDYRPQFLLAESRLAAGRYAEALEDARAAVQAAPEMATTLNLLGRAAAAAGRWDEAEQSFARITALDPKNARAWLNLARAAAETHRGGTGKDALSKAMELAPKDPTVLMTAGDLLMESKQPAPAADYYVRAYALQPSARMAMRACEARLAAGTPQPCTPLTQWLAMNPSDVPARQFEASMYQRRGEIGAAITDYETVLRYRADDPMALNNLAWLYFQSGDARARATAERALAAQPDSAAILDTVGWIRLRSGDPKHGAEAIREAARRAAGDNDIQFHLAFAQAETGDATAAQATLKALLAGQQRFLSRADAEALAQRLAAAERGH